MSKAVKQLVVDEIVRRLKGAPGVLVVSTKGLTVKDAVKFRAALRAKEVRALVVKNSLCGRAFDAMEMGYARPVLDGPSTLIYGGETLVDTAKVLVEAAKGFKMVVLRGGAGDGLVMNAADVTALSKLPGREELLGMVVGALLSGVSGVVGAINAPASQIASQIEKISERTEEEKQAA
jgi:large subunit ribosomal protein L10